MIMARAALSAVPRYIMPIREQESANPRDKMSICYLFYSLSEQKSTLIPALEKWLFQAVYGHIRDPTPGNWDPGFAGTSFSLTRIPVNKKWLFQAVFCPSEGWREIGSDPHPSWSKVAFPSSPLIKLGTFTSGPWTSGLFRK